jgi:hypothetical protein
MDKLAAKRLACWVAAGYVRSCLDAGADLTIHTDGDDTSKDTERLSTALGEVVAELERRGREPQR